MEECDNSIDMGRVRATDMRGNKRINLPPPLEDKKESNLQMRATLWRKIISNYKDEFCNSKGKQKQTLDPELMIGIDKLRKRAAKMNEINTVSDKGMTLLWKILICMRNR